LLSSAILVSRWKKKKSKKNKKQKTPPRSSSKVLHFVVNLFSFAHIPGKLLEMRGLEDLEMQILSLLNTLVPKFFTE